MADHSFTIAHAAGESSSDDPLLWEAVCYLLGELSDADAAEYESRLEGDLPRSEALARAVLLTESLQHLRREPRAVQPSSAPNNPWRYTRRHFVAAAVCAVTLVALGWYGGSRPALDRPGSEWDGIAMLPEGGVRVEPSLLEAWVSLDAESVLDEEETAFEASLELAAADVPDWMFAALFSIGDDSKGASERLVPGIDPLQEGAL